MNVYSNLVFLLSTINHDATQYQISYKIVRNVNHYQTTYAND